MRSWVGIIRSLLSKGLFHILGSNVINKLVLTLNNVILVRLLPREVYGLYGYATNIIALLLIVSGLGVNAGIMQFCSERRANQEKDALYKFGFVCGSVTSCLLSAMALAIGLWANLSVTQARGPLLLMSFIPLLDYIQSFFQALLRTKYENKKYSTLNTINALVTTAFGIIGIWLCGLTGLIISRYFTYLVSIVVGCSFSRGYLKDVVVARRLCSASKVELVKYSAISALSNGISRLLYVLDILLIGVILSDVNVIASYKVASTITSHLIFMPMSLMVFIYPYFASHNEDIAWIRAGTAKVIAASLVINAAISIALFVGAPLIIAFLFGTRYADSLIVFRILAVSYFFSATFRIPCGNILAMLRRVRVNLVISVLSGITNLVLNIVLIREYGSVGAAVATLFVVLLSSLCSGLYLLSLICRQGGGIQRRRPATSTVSGN